MHSGWGHLVPPLFAFVASLTLVAMMRGNATLDGLDRVGLYTYTKATIDRDKALTNNSRASADWAWLFDASDAEHCLDMRALNYPTARFIPGADPRTASCGVELATNDAGNGEIAIVPIYSARSAAGCVPGIYPVEISGGQQGPVAAGTVEIVLNATSANGVQVAITPSRGVQLAGTGYSASFRRQYALCSDRRAALAKQYLDGTSCQRESSQLCTCVRAFAKKVSNPARPLQAILSNGMPLQDALLGGVDACIQTRRAHDVRADASGSYYRSTALLFFALALLFNAIVYLFAINDWGGMYRHLMPLIFLTLLGVLGNGGGADPVLPLCVLLPCFALLGYCVYADWVVASDLKAPSLYLHPVSFDVGLCALTLFTLVGRGVVQREYLIVELFKCHAIAALYAASGWFHRYKMLKPEAAAYLGSANVDDAHRLLVLVALAGAADTLLVPYPAKQCFDLHWLLPVVFVFLGLVSPSFARTALDRAQRLPNEPEMLLHDPSKSHHFNGIPAGLCLGVWLVMWGYFLADHLRVYGGANYPYHSSATALPLLVRGGAW